MHLNPEDGAKVAAAIRAAESATDGEISAIVATSSDNYNDVVLHWALLIALLPLAPLLQHLLLRLRSRCRSDDSGRPASAGLLFVGAAVSDHWTCGIVPA